MSEEARQYRDDIDLAFFVVNFGMSPEEVNNLTGREKSFIRKEWENKIVRDTNLIAKAVNNAVVNAFRKKGGRMIPMWKKINRRDEQAAEEARVLIKRIQQTDDRSWHAKIMSERRK